MVTVSKININIGDLIICDPTYIFSIKTVSVNLTNYGEIINIFVSTERLYFNNSEKLIVLDIKKETIFGRKLYKCLHLGFNSATKIIWIEQEEFELIIRRSVK